MVKSMQLPVQQWQSNAGDAPPGQEGDDAPNSEGGNPGAGEFDWSQYVAGLSDDKRAHLEKNGYKSIDHLLDSDINYSKRMGVPADQLLRVPGASFEDAPEPYVEILKALGASDDAGAYGSPPDTLKFKDDAWGRVTEMFARNNVPPFMASKLLSELPGLIGDIPGGEASGGGVSEDDARDALVGQYGEEAASQMLSDAQALLKAKVSSNSKLAEIGSYLEDTGLGNDPRMVAFLASIAQDYSGSKILNLTDFRSQSEVSKAEAQAELDRIEKDPVASKALFDRNHPDHKSLVERRTELNSIIHGT